LEGDRVIELALREARPREVWNEIEERWFTAAATVAGELGLELRLRAAERSLAMGDGQAAQRWCESLPDRAGDLRVRLARGRALAQLGDLVASKVVLREALGIIER